MQFSGLNFYYISQTLIACRAMQLRIFKLETLLNNALTSHVHVIVIVSCHQSIHEPKPSLYLSFFYRLAQIIKNDIAQLDEIMIYYVSTWYLTNLRLCTFNWQYISCSGLTWSHSVSLSTMYMYISYIVIIVNSVTKLVLSLAGSYRRFKLLDLYYSANI